MANYETRIARMTYDLQGREIERKYMYPSEGENISVFIRNQAYTMDWDEDANRDGVMDETYKWFIEHVKENGCIADCFQLL